MSNAFIGDVMSSARETRTPRDLVDRPLVMHVVGSLEGGGAERCVRELIPRFLARGTNVEVATVYLPNIDPAELARLGCGVHFRAKQPGFDAAHCLWLTRTIAQRKPTIVHTHMQSGKYVGRLAAILAGVPVLIHTEHSGYKVKRNERFFNELLWRRTAAVIAFNNENAGVIRRREPVRHIEIIRNGVTIAPVPTVDERLEARRRLGVDDGTVVFAIVARLQEGKNHRLAFEALADIKNEAGPPVVLALFGDGAMRPLLERLASTLGIADSVRFYGFRPDITGLLPGVDVLLSVSLLEMAPLSILEGMAACLPVVATRHSGTEDMIEDDVTGCIVGWNAESVAQAMRRGRVDSAWRRACGAAGRRRVVRNHDIETIADQHVELYRRMIRTVDD